MGYVFEESRFEILLITLDQMAIDWTAYWNMTTVRRKKKHKLLIVLLQDNKNVNYFESLFDALLIFENDTRFHEHINCFERIFSVPSHIILKDFYSLKDTKKVVKLRNKFISY